MTQTGFSIPMTNCTSSYMPFNNDWSDGDVFFDKDFTTPDNSELFSELNDTLGCSIYQDIKQIIENQSSPFESSNSSVTSEIYETPKYEIRNHDCMWSGATINNVAFAGGAIKREPIDIIDINHKIKIEPGEIESDSDESQENHHQHYNNQQNKNHPQKKQQKHKQHRMSDDNSTDHKHAVHMQKFQNQQLLQQQQNLHQKQQNHNNNNNNEELTKINTCNISSPNTKSQKHQNMQSIPAGASLLLSSPMNQQKKVSNVSNHRPSPIQIPTITPLDFIRDRENYFSISSNDGNNNINNCGGVSGGGSGGVSLCRPDTPLSLDDDAPEFKHTVDLAACVTGTNSLVLDNETMIINKLRAQLEDVSKENIDMQLLNDGHQHHINDVLSVIDNECNYNSYRCSNNKEKDRYDNNSNYDISMLKLNNNIGDVYINNRYGGNSCNRRRDGCIENSDGESTDSDGSEDDEDDEEEEDSISAISKSSMLFKSSQNTTTTLGHSVMHSDHSYTRSKDGVDVTGMGMETPSDSDEEIDVVSIGDKKLPTNPSDKDCRVLLNKISARMVKTPNGLRTIPPRRRGSYDPPYTPANSITPIKSGSSLASSRYPSPTSTPYSYSSSNGVGSTKYHSSNTSSNSSSRKRSSAVSLSSSTSSYRNVDDYAPPSNKRQRSKKQKSSSVTPVKQQHNRHYSVDEADTIEKRNLHNNMERQRRIGLKNLFEALKKQIPSIKDKERAPKVNILREAAKLCSQLTRDYEHMNAQQQVLQDQIRNRQEFLNRLKVLRSIRSD